MYQCCSSLKATAALYSEIFMRVAERRSSAEEVFHASGCNVDNLAGGIQSLIPEFRLNPYPTYHRLRGGSSS
jgi:hypothetical protein